MDYVYITQADVILRHTMIGYLVLAIVVISVGFSLLNVVVMRAIVLFPELADWFGGTSRIRLLTFAIAIAAFVVDISL